jgi:predicted amidohydrolase YtcJ
MTKALFLCGVALAGAAHAAEPADLVLDNARIVTEDAVQPQASALAVRDGRIVYIGNHQGAQAFVGAATKVQDAHGHLVLPGLVDAHIHPLAIADVPSCTLDSRPVALNELAGVVQDCIRRFAIKPGEWIAVTQWNFSMGNAPSADLPTLRVALDRAAPGYPVALLGNDGHHGAYNSLAMARAHNTLGKTVGYSKATLATDFAAQAPLIGVDAQGEPNGTVNEEARDLMGSPDLLTVNFAEVMQHPEKVPERLASAGITAIQDAFVTPTMVPYYDLLRRSGQMSFRVNLMQLYNPEEFRTPAGAIDYAAVVNQARTIRAHFAGDDLVRSEAVKIFADGVLEGNPYADPPTQPDAPSLKPYLQPIFAPGPDGKPMVKGYVDTASPLCAAVRAHPEAYADGAAFKRAHGYLPAQCAISYGRLQHDRQVILNYARAAHLAGFTLHIHAIADAAVRTAVDAIEGARAADGNDHTPDTIAHLQVVAPEDIARIGRDHLFLAYTYSWANVDPDYDLSVIPFFEKVSGTAFHNPASYYDRQFYPVRQTRDAGAVLVAGSDAPVNTPDPQPFVNMQLALTRALPGKPAANPAERITLPEVLRAYTIDGARAMGRDREFGSLAPGKSADFIEIDQDIFALEQAGQADRIGHTRVLGTWFRGKQVYTAPRP